MANNIYYLTSRCSYSVERQLSCRVEEKVRYSAEPIIKIFLFFCESEMGMIANSSPIPPWHPLCRRPNISCGRSPLLKLQSISERARSPLRSITRRQSTSFSFHTIRQQYVNSGAHYLQSRIGHFFQH